MRTFLVDCSILLESELMIGGSDMIVPAASRTTGYLSKPAMSGMYLATAWTFSLVGL